MRESTINKKIMSVMFGALLIGGVAALVKVYTVTKDIEYSFKSVAKEGDVEIFI